MICIRIREPGAGDQQQRGRRSAATGSRIRSQGTGSSCSGIHQLMICIRIRSSCSSQEPEPGAGRSAAGAIFCSHRRGIRASEQPEGETRRLNSHRRPEPGKFGRNQGSGSGIHQLMICIRIRSQVPEISSQGGRSSCRK